MAIAPDSTAINRLHFTSEGAIRPLADEKLNFFEALGLPPRLTIDAEKTHQTYLDLSRKFHPDYFANESDELRAESLKRSSLLNNAWKTLQNPLKRAEYLITLLGDKIESSKNSAPPSLLEEMFEIQEAGEELRDARESADAEKLARAEAKIQPLRDKVKAARKELEAQINEQSLSADQAAEAGDPERLQRELRALRTQLDQMNYLRTVLRNLK